MAPIDSSPVGWSHIGRHRPPFAVRPTPGQESVWDYPRPPRLALDEREVVVRRGAFLVAATRRAIRVLECFVAGERVRPQPGDFYGGWVTADIVGPFKGEPGTSGW